MDERVKFNRFKDAPWFPKEDCIVLIGGAGGIGSWTTLLLSRAGFKPVVYDFDMLEEHNLGGQLFPKYSIGKSKVEALQDTVLRYSDDEIIVFADKIDESTPTNIYAIAAFDNMEARNIMYRSWLMEFGDNPNAIFIDGRLTAEQMQIFCIKGGTSEEIKSKQELYMTEYLFNDSEVEDAPCTFKQTSHSAAMIASHIVGFFTNHITNIIDGDDARSVPFFCEYFIPMNLLEVQN